MALAERQHGVVHRAQLLGRGFTASAIGRRVDTGRLHVLYPGVYAVGRRRVTREGHWMAAVFAGGTSAVLSHISGAALWGMIRPTDEAIHITTPRRHQPHRGLRFHSAALPDDEVTVLQGIPVTTVPRTLLDLAAVVPRDRLEKATNEVEVQRLGYELPLADLIARHPGRRGLRNLRAVLAAGEIGAVTRSDLEEAFRVFLRDAAVPSPELNAPLELNGRWYEVDALWRAPGLAVELDSWAFHATKRAFARDRAKDRALRAAGLEVVRVTWWDLHPNATELEADLTTLLAASAPTRPGRRSSPG